MIHKSSRFSPENQARSHRYSIDAEHVALWRRFIRPLCYLLLLGMLVKGIWPLYFYTIPEAATHMPPGYPPGVTVIAHGDFNAAEQLHVGDGVLFKVVTARGTIRMFSRVVAKPGAYVKFVNRTLYINDEPADERYLAHVTLGDPRPSKAEVTVPPGCLYVLNDDRNSPIQDSRDFGPLQPDQILGKIVFPDVERAK